MKKFSKVFFLILGFAVLLSGCTFLEKEELHNGLVINLPSNNKGGRSAVEYTDLFSTFEVEEVSLYTVSLTNGKQTFQGQGEPGEQILISNIPAGHWTLTSYAWVGNQWDGYEAAGKNIPKDIVIKPYTVVTEDVALVKIAFISGKEALVSETIEITENTSFIANECDVTFKRAEGFDGDIFHVAEGAVLNLIGMDDEEWFYIYVDGSSEEFVNGRLVTVEGTLNATNVYFMNNNIKNSSNPDNPNSGSAIQVEAGGTLHMEECIVKGNSILSPGIGAGIYLKDGSTSYLYGVTLYNNTVLDGDNLNPRDADNDIFIDAKADVSFGGYVNGESFDSYVNITYRPLFDENGEIITWSEDNKPIKLLSSDWMRKFELNVDYLEGDNDVPLYYVNKRAFFDGEGDIIDKAMNGIKVKKQPEEYTGDVYYVSTIDNSLVKLSDDLKGKKILSDVSDLKTAMNVSGDYLLYAGEGGEIILNEELNPNKTDVEVSILALEPVTFKRSSEFMTKGSGKYMLNVFCAYNSAGFKADDTKYNLILGTVNPDDRITFDGTSTTPTYCPIGVNYGSARFTNIIVCNSNSSGNGAAGMNITDKTELINCTFKDNFDNTNTPDSIGVLRVNSPDRVLFENLVFENNKHSTPQGISREVFDIRFTNLGETDTFIFKGTINGKAYYHSSDENFKKTTVITDGFDPSSKINLSFYSGTSISIVPGYSNPTN